MYVCVYTYAPRCGMHKVPENIPISGSTDPGPDAGVVPGFSKGPEKGTSFDDTVSPLIGDGSSTRHRYQKSRSRSDSGDKVTCG